MKPRESFLSVRRRINQLSKQQTDVPGAMMEISEPDFRGTNLVAQSVQHLSLCLLIAGLLSPGLLPVRPAMAQLFTTSVDARGEQAPFQNASILQDPSRKTASDAFALRVENQDSEPKKETVPIIEWGTKYGEPRAVVIMLHGLLQHAECFAPIANHLAQKGYLVVALDQRGHGSRHFQNHPNDPGYAIDYAGSIEDLTAVARELRAQHPTLPLFCLGESAGAAITVRSATRSPGIFDGLILCAFATKPRAVRILWTAEDVIDHVLHWNREIQMSRYIQKFSSEDARIKLETINDPLCRTGISLSEFMDTCNFMKHTGKLAKRLQPNLPLLMLEGQDDQVLDPKSSKKFLARARCENKNLVIIPHCGHVLVSTHYLKPLVISSIDDWLDSHTPGQFATNAIVAGRK